MSFKFRIQFTQHYKILLLILFIITLCTLAINVSRAATLYESVEKAIRNNPQLKALKHHRQAVEYELDQSSSKWKPILDLTMGYGADQHSDSTTRAIGADPNDTDWDAVESATLKLTQKIYDGGETSNEISIGKANLNSAQFELQSAIQAVALNAVIAHINVLRQRELVELCGKNLEAHKSIHKLLAEREQAGAGSMAEVTQARARLARAESILALTRASLGQAMAAYSRATGSPARTVDYSGKPDSLPHSLEEALKLAEKTNPELMILNAEFGKAESQLGIARSQYHPKLDFELSSSYNNHLEGNSSWEQTNSAMIMMRWNLFNGGRDKAGVAAALSRKNQIHWQRNAKWEELKETISADWDSHTAIQAQKKSFKDAVKYSRKTFNAYLNQFSISQRTLLDLLIAENDFYQSATQLVNIYMDETITGYRILASIGLLKVPECNQTCKDYDSFKLLNQLIKFPSISTSFAVPDTGTETPELIENTDNIKPEPVEPVPHAVPVAVAPQTLKIKIGPFINAVELDDAKAFLKSKGIKIIQKTGKGPVKMLRFLIGIYPRSEAQAHLKALKKKIRSGFLLPQKGQLGIYAGSFRPCHRAETFRQKLTRKKIKFTEVESLVNLKGTILIVQIPDKNTADEIMGQMHAKHISTTNMDNR